MARIIISFHVDKVTTRDVEIISRANKCVINSFIIHNGNRIREYSVKRGIDLADKLEYVTNKYGLPETLNDLVYSDVSSERAITLSYGSGITYTLGFYQKHTVPIEAMFDELEAVLKNENVYPYKDISDDFELEVEKQNKKKKRIIYIAIIAILLFVSLSMIYGFCGGKEIKDKLDGMVFGTTYVVDPDKELSTSVKFTFGDTKFEKRSRLLKSGNPYFDYDTDVNERGSDGEYPYIVFKNLFGTYKVYWIVRNGYVMTFRTIVMSLDRDKSIEGLYYKYRWYSILDDVWY
ncbi:MAG: hypothetical protein IJM49_05910 [Firmicutes bacterium]|nr:hypothetical protein [Bacillota bacterium]